nr:hypothetical protein [Paenibacillus phytorum]
MELIIESVSKKYKGDFYGLRDLSLQIQTGVLGLLGPNGAGKCGIQGVIGVTQMSVHVMKHIRNSRTNGPSSSHRIPKIPLRHRFPFCIEDGKQMITLDLRELYSTIGHSKRFKYQIAQGFIQANVQSSG